MKRFPDALALLTGGILLAAALTWVLPAGRFERQPDEATGREVVVAGSYAPVERQPVGPLEAMFAIPRGIVEAADVIALVLLVGGAFVVVDRTGALRAGLDALLARIGHRPNRVIPLVAIAFAIGGVTFNMQEEIVALIPVLLLLARRTGFDPLAAVAMSVGAAVVGSAFSPMNPFQVGIAQGIADVPLYSGWQYRTVFLLLALGLWIRGTLRHAQGLPSVAGATRSGANADPAPETGTLAFPSPSSAATGPTPGRNRTMVILMLVVLAFATFIFGITRLGWGFIEMAGVFFVMGVLAGLTGALGVNGTARAYADGLREMTYAAVLIGFARAIYVILNDGQIVDTIVHGLFTPLEALPRTAAVLGMTSVQALIHVPVPSVSGQAVLTLPILVPLSDLLGIARQVTILAYQFGAGLCDMLTPTNGALMAALAAAGIRYDSWLRFAFPLWTLLMGLGAIALVLAMLIGLG